ncbi:YybH family protein [Spirosoma soli]|uniref:YybH family protein n=1 Tax=Spirosoma soli TaxID=1770529 RepID=A0ABW5M0J9_9BACT
MIRLASFFVLFVLYSAIGFAKPKPVPDEIQIRRALDSTSAGWNRGNLQQYLGAYTPDAQEMGPNGPRGGVEVIENTMKKGFWKTGRPLQQLRYEHVNVRLLGKTNALVTGQFVLTGGGKEDRTGWFTTVWEKTRDGWRMIFDHS